MKYLLSYFSLTNNTKFVASTIKKGILASDAEAQVDLKALEKIAVDKIGEVYGDYDVIGVGTLVWAWDSPLLVQKHLKSIPDGGLKGKKAFVFSTAGGAHGGTSSTLQTILNGKGAVVIDCLELFGPGNWTPLVKAVPEGSELAWPSGAWSPADDFGKKLPGKVAEGKEIPKLKYPLFAYPTWGLTKVFPNGLKWKVGKIQWNPETCRGEKCSKCVKGCPWNALAFNDTEGGAVLLRNDSLCTGCCKCINVCPTASWKRKSDKPGAWRQYFYSSKLLVEGAKPKQGGQTFMKKQEFEKAREALKAAPVADEEQ